MAQRAVFFDRDGTLSVDPGHYLVDPAEVVLQSGVGPALRRLMDAGFLLFIVTNQPGIGRGQCTQEQVDSVNARVVQLLAMHGVTFAKVYVAPEANDEGAYGRKPSPQFLLDAARHFSLDLRKCYMVGDKAKDVDCGINADVCLSLLVLTGDGERYAENVKDRAVVVADVPAAVDFILADSNPAKPVIAVVELQRYE